MTEQSKPTNTSVWEDLVVSILSVNQYTLQNTYKSFDSMKEMGLFDPQNLSSWNVQQIEHKLKSANCDRGLFMTNLFSIRLSEIGKLISVKGIIECERILSEGSDKDIQSLLLPVKGIGPKVLENFFLLRKVSV